MILTRDDSVKTAAFLVPLLYILKKHSVRAFVIEPVFIFSFLLIFLCCCFPVVGERKKYRQCLKLTELFETVKGQSVVTFPPRILAKIKA